MRQQQFQIVLPVLIIPDFGDQECRSVSPAQQAACHSCCRTGNSAGHQFRACIPLAKKMHTLLCTALNICRAAPAQQPQYLAALPALAAHWGVVMLAGQLTRLQLGILAQGHIPWSSSSSPSLALARHLDTGLFSCCDASWLQVVQVAPSGTLPCPIPSIRSTFLDFLLLLIS